MADDFSEIVKRILASRVGTICSNPECRVPTSGPQDDPSKAVNIGVAAHITASSLGGPRYAPSLSPAERSAAENGIWLCQNCAKLVDNDIARFTVDVLNGWKSVAESEARNRLGKMPSIGSELGIAIPSFVFVFGAPLGDNDSAVWVMMLKHYGPKPARNCKIAFFDNDRKKIEHEWLLKNPRAPFLPSGMFEDSQTSLYVPEAGREESIGSFNWRPLDPDRQHYTVSLSCRDGFFVQKWDVTRVDGILRSRVVIERGPQWVEENPTLDPLVFECKDPEFVNTDLLTEVPTRPPKEVHPGWKPNHKFEVPVAIVDPNGHIQVISAVKLPDGSTRTDFGCWNILTRHFGDNPNTERSAHWSKHESLT